MANTTARLGNHQMLLGPRNLVYNSDILGYCLKQRTLSTVSGVCSEANSDLLKLNQRWLGAVLAVFGHTDLDPEPCLVTGHRR